MRSGSQCNLRVHVSCASCLCEFFLSYRLLVIVAVCSESCSKRQRTAFLFFSHLSGELLFMFLSKPFPDELEITSRGMNTVKYLNS